MMELIEFLDKEIENPIWSTNFRDGLIHAKEFAESLLPKERQTIEEEKAKAFDEGVQVTKKYWRDQYRYSRAFEPTNPYNQNP